MALRWDGFDLDVPARRLTGSDGEVHLEPQVFDVLVYLIDNRDRVVTKEELLDNVWGDQFVSESALTTRIKNARRALGDDGRTQRYIRNVHGRGYQFVGDLEPEAVSSASPISPTPPDVVPEPVSLALAISVDDEFPFVGRSAELERIGEAIAAADGSVQVFIGGAPGLGKSRLALEALARQAGDGVIVCAGRCDEQVTSDLQPIRDAVAQLAIAHPAEFAGWSDGVDSPLRHLIPSIGAVRPGPATPIDAYAGLEVLMTVLERAAADRPLRLLVDDLQWSDQATRSLLAQLHRRFANRPIAAIATFRSGVGDLRPGAKRWIADQLRLDGSMRIDLGELDSADARELVRAVVGDGDGDVASSLVERTGGHSLFLTESLRDHQMGLTASASVADLIVARLERLSEPDQEIVRTGAVLGPEFSFSVAAAAAGMDPAAALEAIDRAVTAELLHETASASRFRFSHQLVPEAIRTTMSRPALAVVHHRCAQALEAEEADPVEVAVHLLGAIPLVQTEDAVRRSVDAATAARDSKQFDRAIRLLERCLAVEMQVRQRAEILIFVGELLVASGRSVRGAPRFEEAADLARRNGWVDILVAAALGHYGRSPFRKPTDTSTRRLLEEALAAVGDGPSIDRARLLGKMAAFSLFSVRLDYRDKLSSEALAMATAASPIDRMELLESRAIVFACPAGLEELERIHPELEELREQTDTYFADAAAPETPLLMRGDGDGLREVAKFDEVRVRSQPIAEWRDLVLRSTLAVFAGDFDEARRLCDDAERIGEPYWGDSSFVLHAFGLQFVDSISGDWDRSVEAFALLHDASDSAMFTAPLAWSHAGRGDLERARAIADEIRISSFRWLGEHIMGGNVLVAAAEVGLALDDDDLCTVAEDHLRPFAHIVLGVPWACSQAAADPLSRLARRRGALDEADAHAMRARELYSTLDAPALLERVN